MSGKKRGNDLMQFMVGLVMFVAGGYLFLDNVAVYGISFGLPFWRNSPQGVVFVPLIASIIFLFYRYNLVSKICCGLSMTLIIAVVISNMHVAWKATSLFVTVVIFVLLFGGVGLLAKVLFANPEGDHGKNYR